MKNYLHLLLVLLDICYCLEDSDGSGNCWHGDKHDVRHLDPIVRPCSPYDTYCIRDYLARHSHCSVTHGPVPDPLHLDRATLPLPIANITFVLNNIQVKGLDTGKVIVFYVNKKTDNLVIEVEMRNLTVYSKHTQIKYYRKGKEPIVLVDFTTITFKKIAFTITIPNLNDLELSKADVYTYLDDSNPVYMIGSKAIPKKDLEAMASQAALAQDILTSIKEAFVFHGPDLMRIYIQQYLCDFGLPVNVY